MGAFRPLKGPRYSLNSNTGNLEGLSAEGAQDLMSVLSGSLWLSMETRDETTAPVQAVDGEGHHDVEKGLKSGCALKIKPIGLADRPYQG